MDIENCDTLAAIKPRIGSNTRRLVAQRNFLKIYLTLCPCPVLAETCEEDSGLLSQTATPQQGRLV